MRVGLVVGLMMLMAVPVMAQKNDDVRREKLRRLRREYILKKYDVDKDGRLSRQERQALHRDRKARRNRLLAQFDKNKDGRLDRTERMAMRQARRTRRAVARYDGLLQRHDANKDGKLAWTEIKPKAPGRARWMRKRFIAADVNGDGIVDRAEFTAAAKRVNKLQRQPKR